jgi:hypothetical protein
MMMMMMMMMMNPPKMKTQNGTSYSYELYEVTAKIGRGVKTQEEQSMEKGGVDRW